MGFASYYDIQRLRKNQWVFASQMQPLRSRGLVKKIQLVLFQMVELLLIFFQNSVAFAT
jgi:hypothetical protein